MDRFYDFVGVNFYDALFVLLNTLLIFFVARRFLFGPVMKLIQDRQREIDDMYAAAGKAKDSAAALESAYRQELTAAAETGERMVREAVARGRSREEEILRQANREAEAIREKAAADIAREKKKALREAKDEISEMALSIAGKVIGRELDAAGQESLVDHFIDELGERT